MSDAVLAQAVLLKMENGAQTLFNTVSEVLSISGPSASPEQIDVTNQDSPGGYREFIAGLIDPGELTFDINYIPTNTTHNDSADGLLGVMAAREVRNWELHFPTSPVVKFGFAGIISGFDVSPGIGEQLKASVTIKISGAIDWSK